jgi:hypothetical protein
MFPTNETCAEKPNGHNFRVYKKFAPLGIDKNELADPNT